jgi:hypothetical protein
MTHAQSRKKFSFRLEGLPAFCIVSLFLVVGFCHNAFQDKFYTDISIETLCKRREALWYAFLNDYRWQQDAAMRKTDPDYGAIGKNAVLMSHLRDGLCSEESLVEKLVKSRNFLRKDSGASLNLWIKTLAFDQ